MSYLSNRWFQKDTVLAHHTVKVGKSQKVYFHFSPIIKTVEKFQNSAAVKKHNNNKYSKFDNEYVIWRPVKMTWSRHVTPSKQQIRNFKCTFWDLSTFKRYLSNVLILSPVAFSISAIFATLQHRGAFCQFPFLWIYYYHSSKSTREETGKTHLCAVHCKADNNHFYRHNM